MHLKLGYVDEFIT